MQLHTIQRHTPRKYSRSVGRGGKRGKTSGRGTKGQKARAGRKIRPEVRDVIMRLPKLRGYRFKSRFKKPVPISVDLLERSYSDGETVSPATLSKKDLVSSVRGAIPGIKILSGKALSKKLTVTGCAVSAAAREQIVKAGGTVA